jgi:hypothetical protein
MFWTVYNLHHSYNCSGRPLQKEKLIWHYLTTYAITYDKAFLSFFPMHIITLLGNDMKVKYHPILFPNHVKWVPWHHSMVHPQVVDGDDFQIWKVAANIQNKQSRTADKGWSSSLGVGCRTNNSSQQKIILLWNITKGLGLGTHSLDKWSKLMKLDMRFGMRNVRSLYRADLLMTVAKERSKW